MPTNHATARSALFAALCASSSMSIAAAPPGQGADPKSIEQQLQESRDAVLAARAEAKRLAAEAEKAPKSSNVLMDTPAIKAARAEWTRALYRKIEPNWIRPTLEESRDYPCKATVRLLRDGSVVYVVFRSPCSALGLVERSIEAAVYKSSPLPVPSDPAAFVSTLSISFAPGSQ